MYYSYFVKFRMILPSTATSILLNFTKMYLLKYKPVDTLNGYNLFQWLYQFYNAQPNPCQFERNILEELRPRNHLSNSLRFQLVYFSQVLFPHHRQDIERQLDTPIDQQKHHNHIYKIPEELDGASYSSNLKKIFNNK